MLFPPEEHADNPPSSWIVQRVGRKWHLSDKNNRGVLGSFDTKEKAEAARHTGFCATLYAKEGRWYAGENIEGWEPYKSVAKK